MKAVTQEAPITAVAAAPGASDRNSNYYEEEPIMSSIAEPAAAVEQWRMPSGRVATINLNDPEPAIETARELLAMNGAERIDADNSPDQSCAYGWCDMGDDAGGHADFPGMHRKRFHRGPLRLDFIVDNEEDGGTYISWNDTIDITFGPDDLGRLNSIAADLIVAKAAFDQFVEEVSK